MRISSIGFHRNGISGIMTAQKNLNRAEIELSSQKRLLNPHDDPLATSHVRALNAHIDRLETFNTNNKSSINKLALVETTLNSITDSFLKLDELEKQCMSGTLQQKDKNTIALEMQQILDECVTLANSQDGDGSYMFSGFSSDKLAFVKQNDAYQYQGDQGQQKVQIGSNAFVNISYSGATVFSNEESNVFNSIQQMIKSLATPLDNNFTQQDFLNAMAEGSKRLDEGLEKVLLVTTQLGSNINTLENQSMIHDDLIMQNKDLLSSLQDIDPATAASNLAIQMNILQAAYVSFSKVSELSLINYI